jgi:hypothetical protein
MATTNLQSFAGDVVVEDTLTATLVGNVSGNISGSAGSATNAAYANSAGSSTNATYASSTGAAATVDFTDRNNTNDSDYVAFVGSHTSGNKALYTDSGLYYNSSTHYLNANALHANNVATVADVSPSTGANASSIAQRNTSGDLKARLFRTNYVNQNDISGALAYRINAGNNDYIRFCSSKSASRTFLNVPTRSGGDASGTWSIDISGSCSNATYATSAANATDATYAGTATNTTHANKANKVAFTDRDNSNNTDYIAFVDSHAAGDKAMFTDSNLTYNSSTNHINANVPYANNASNIGGISASMNSAVNTVVIRHSDGHIYMNHGFATYFNMSHATGTRNGDSIFYSSYDSYIRKNAAGNFRSSLDVPTRTGGNAGGTWGINVNGSGKVNGNISYTLKCTGVPSPVFEEGYSVNYSAYGRRAAAPYTTPHMGANQAPYTGNLSLDYGLRTTYGIVSHTGFWAYSDRRIKENITTIDTKEALSKVNKLKPVGYIRKDNRRHDLGFIAQEVQEEIPEAVRMTSGYVGDICEYGTISDKKLFCVADEDNPTTAYQYTFTTFAPLPETIDTSNAFVFQIEYRPDGTIDDGINAETIDAVYNPENCGEVEGNGTIFKFIVDEGATDIIDENEDGVFRIFGTLKYDFLALCPSEIVSLVTASVQEIDKQRLQDLERLNELQAKYEEFTKRVDTLRGN